MGYEIVFHYKNATEQPGVYEDEIKTKSCKVGKVNEDIYKPLLVQQANIKQEGEVLNYSSSMRP
jgi:hypothetical protein